MAYPPWSGHRKVFLGNGTATFFPLDPSASGWSQLSQLHPTPRPPLPSPPPPSLYALPPTTTTIDIAIPRQKFVCAADRYFTDSSKSSSPTTTTGSRSNHRPHAGTRPSIHVCAPQKNIKTHQGAIQVQSLHPSSASPTSSSSSYVATFPSCTPQFPHTLSFRTHKIVTATSPAARFWVQIHRPQFCHTIPAAQRKRHAQRYPRFASLPSLSRFGCTLLLVCRFSRYTVARLSSSLALPTMPYPTHTQSQGSRRWHFLPYIHTRRSDRRARSTFSKKTQADPRGIS